MVEDIPSAIQAALTFEVNSLFQHCHATILNNLTIHNICTKLKQFHNYDCIKKSLISFVISNIDQVKGTDDWPILCSQCPDLLAEIISQISHQK